MIIRAKLNEKKRTYRDIYVDSDINLETLASYVVAAFGFDFDHCYGFFQSPDIYAKGRNLVHYELFYDIGEEVNPKTRSVVKTAIADIFKAKKDKWWMLFDYGDDWIFELECIADDDQDQSTTGEVIKSSGEAPKQYHYEDEDYDDEEIE